MYALRVLRSHGLSEQSLKDVFQATGETVCSLDENDNSQITTTESNVQHTGKRKQEAQLLPRDCAMRHVS